ncbi:MAG: ATP-dependent Clp protease proteolytic subunit [Oligosphaeraceae bacterium]
MTRVNISGVILPDDVFPFADWLGDIERGCVTTPCCLAAALATAADDVEVHINSFGGDVFAASTMDCLLANWRREHPGRGMTYIVEAYAMSAAANLVASAPRESVRVHENSLIMFHSCSTFTVGGPGAHKDAAELMDKVNRRVIACLAQTTLDPDQVETWFAEGRQGWLDAREAVGCLLAAAVIGEPSEPAPARPEKGRSPDVDAFFTGQTGRLAAYLEPRQERTMKLRQEEDPEIPETEPENEPECPEKTEPDQGCDPEPEPEQNEDTEPCGPDKAEDEITQLRQEIEHLRLHLRQATEAIARLTPGMRQTKPQTSPSQDWRSLVAAIPKGLPQQEWDRRFVELKSIHRDAYQSYLKNH